MFRFILIVSCVIVVSTGLRGGPTDGSSEASTRVRRQAPPAHEDLAQPSPYEYAYTAESDEGSHGHSEKFDGVSRIEGTYFLKLADGRERTVYYTADEDGFHPEIHTNELGTESKNPGDSVFISSAPSGPDAAIEAYGGPFPESLGKTSKAQDVRGRTATSAAKSA